MDKIVNYVECDQCGSPIIEGDYCDISRDGHVFCGIQCTLDFYGIRCFAFSHTELMSSETQLNWKQCKASELDCIVKRTREKIWRADNDDK